MSTTSSRNRRRISKPAMVAGLVLGLAMGVAAIVSDRLWLGLAMLAIMAAFVLFVVLGARVSDTVALLGDDTHEERNVQIHQRAALYTLNILAFVIVGAAIVDIARGGDGDPWAFLALVAGVTYAVSLLVLNRRH
ncbi:MAG: YbfB/YjiJ family MFS transporter [Actinopolymorphaceae bacterium]